MGLSKGATLDGQQSYTLRRPHGAAQLHESETAQIKGPFKFGAGHDGRILVLVHHECQSDLTVHTLPC